MIAIPSCVKQESMCTVYYQAQCTELIVDDDVSLLAGLKEYMYDRKWTLES